MARKTKGMARRDRLLPPLPRQGLWILARRLTGERVGVRGNRERGSGRAPHPNPLPGSRPLPRSQAFAGERGPEALRAGESVEQAAEEGGTLEGDLHRLVRGARRQLLAAPCPSHRPDDTRVPFKRPFQTTARSLPDLPPALASRRDACREQARQARPSRRGQGVLERRQAERTARRRSSGQADLGNRPRGPPLILYLDTSGVSAPPAWCRRALHR